MNACIIGQIPHSETLGAGMPNQSKISIHLTALMVVLAITVLASLIVEAANKANASKVAVKSIEKAEMRSQGK